MKNINNQIHTQLYWEFREQLYLQFNHHNLQFCSQFRKQLRSPFWRPIRK
jgi:hypothetical protein